MTNNITYWRGVPLDPRTRDQCVELATLVDWWLLPTQGSYRPTSRYSADTHGGGGAVDFSLVGLTRLQERALVAMAEKVGMTAHIRPAITGLWPRHAHVLSNPPRMEGPGVLHWSAWEQIKATMMGYDGLASYGPDLNPELRLFRTWEDYQSIDEGEDEMSPEEIYNQVRKASVQAFKDVLNDPKLMHELSRKIVNDAEFYRQVRLAANQATKDFLNDAALTNEAARKLQVRTNVASPFNDALEDDYLDELPD